MTLDDLLTLSNRQLADLLAAGRPVDADALIDMEYRGTSLGLPAFVDRLLWKTFVKTFHRDPQTGAVRGWNVRMEQTGLDGPLVPMKRRGVPLTFGHYAVQPAVDGPGLSLDYGAGGNPWYDVMRVVKDPLVSLDGSPDLLLGGSVVHLGPARWLTPAFFALQRARPLTHVAWPGQATRLLAPATAG